MVHIKKLEVYGFKSFGFKNTVVHFEKGLIAVTGPNGSGKSNILDAIMFAIGENSPKALRVDKFQSLFHDSHNSSHRLIRVSLTFDNTDRGIPVDEDSVTLTREMEGQNGESQYSLNGKKVSKTTIMELLEVVLAAPNKLNIVQQGMITRISELNSEERRKIIEDIVGLSYFDEKKAEAMKQLDEADRRLEVAFARMGEIRKRIDELEAERNDQLRYDQIGSELKRFKAVQISNTIRTVRHKLATSTQILESNNMKSSQLSKKVDELRLEIEKLDAEKTKFIQEVDAATRAKAQVASRISSVVHDSERTKAMLGESERRIVEIERRLPAIDSGKQVVAQRMESARAEAEKLKVAVEQKKATMAELRTKLDALDAEIEKITAKVAKYAAFRNKLGKRHARMSALKGQIELAATRVEEKIKTINYKKSSNDAALGALQSEILAAKHRIAEMEKSLENDKKKLQETSGLVAELAEAKAGLEKELAGSASLLIRAESLATKFEERASVAKNAMNEDFAIAELMKEKDKFGIRGLVHDLIMWDKNYERAVLAAGSEWMKAFVVDDIKSMILIAAYAKERRLPRLRIIPFDVVMRFKENRDIPDDDVNVIGKLSDFVQSDYRKLPEFLFSDTLLVRNSSSAFMLARQGYRTVSAEGELFEPAGGSMALDFGGKITDMTKAILFGDSVEELRGMLAKLSKTVEKKNAQLQEIAERIASSEAEKVRLELAIGNLESRIAAEHEAVSAKEKSVSQFVSGNQILQSEADMLAAELGKYSRRLELLVPAIGRLSSRLQSIGDEPSSKSELAAKNLERNQIIKAIDTVNIELGQATSMLAGLEGRLELDTRQLGEMDNEKERLSLELEQRRRQMEELKTKSQSLEAELKGLRDQEQQIIDSSGSAYSVLQEYERKIKAFTENERKLSKEHNIIERESALLRKDIADLTAEESRQTNDLVWLGYKNLLDEMDVGAAIKELTDEYENVKSRINLRADEAYVQVMDGYRGMSTRRNQLESERNSIVSFIEEIVKEKEKVFMEAFQKVDSDIRITFERMTGGAAWLEIENPADVFSSGVMLLVRFPNKTVPRESTALSGGEKTIAATVFLLALQSLKPSPFYLMDEVDAHLDAQNTERLSKVLLERSKDSQIIMVTLKDSTVAKAALIYGVYPKEGASQVVKYKNPAQIPLAQISENKM
ncbi:chromosome segregation protein SMC [Candidatus Nitrososphaera gargensis Ga9.2]|uniref:Chromosome segregation protein SMC n=1 Tax=Nitrososphaera gargensis (strain Ga9.2) TaxID=1237085 RepID=K0IN66_NITGG|nr:chromosome segregation SMC family protein [Candidatus Nitrososphaera gargensis]AFU58839.1 chromosome segregation protein SMC [Candidatus Nitrososphaera gargensis Ga9.2]